MSDKNVKLLERFLPAIPVFSRVSPKYLQRIMNDFNFRLTPKEQVVFHQGDTSTDLYVILGGRVRVILTSEEGEDLVLNEQGAGDFFGEVSLIDGEPRSATVVANEDCILAVLSRGRLLDLIKSEPLVAVDLLSSLTHRLRKATEREESLAFLDVRERLCRFFMQAALEEGEKQKDGSFVIRKRTHKDLANRIGTSRESITKMLKSLAKEKLVYEKKNALCISPAICQEPD